MPPYVIFHDASLTALMEHKPETLAQLSMLHGVGKRKLELYGKQFLAIIQNFNGTTTMNTDTATESL